ncbi:transcription factor Adf-1 [Zeugodacus cucurbitae]|uniref:Transcription factor Adf-1 n=1 Tax=Zeugodacus cucurbitae TaxID=28588 RepID=A0A0A1WPX7_ZEUCU|nr:transcription factor Adf-1 [Zeugodacus cucurbitae]
MDVKSDFDTKLVEMVRANPLLYEKEVRSTPYDLMKKKTELWRSIASSLNVETKFCVIRWKNLRDKYRRESQKTQELERKAGGIKSAQGATWHLLDKMSFLDHHIRVHSSNSTKSAAENIRTSWSEMDAEQLIEQLPNDDDPLQEAMEEQAVVAVETKKPDPLVSTATTNTSCLKRIETLLEGLDEDNRTKAEKRVVAYLCKCQLKFLENESIDDIVI